MIEQMTYGDKIKVKAFIPLLKNISKLMTIEQIKALSNCSYHKFFVNGKDYLLMDSEKMKVVIGEDYNYIFDKTNGKFVRYGRTYEEDPEFSPLGGEILDIEVTTSCNGINGQLCRFCYKSNTPNGENMSFETFKNILDKQGKQLTQVAFGIDSQATSNPDLWKMAQYCRSKGVIPNVTNISDEVADKLALLMGAVACSRYDDKNVCYDSVKKLTDRGMKQINIHFMICESSYDACMETLRDIKTDPRLEKLNAIVMLSLKKKGRGIGFTSLSQDKYNDIIKYCLENNINFGMDSCGAKKFLDAVKDHPNYEDFKVVSEPCESTNFSQYIDVEGNFYPCSFCEGAEGWEQGIDVKKCSSFLKDIWYNDRVIQFRNRLNSNCNNCHKARECIIYEV